MDLINKLFLYFIAGYTAIANIYTVISVTILAITAIVTLVIIGAHNELLGLLLIILLLPTALIAMTIYIGQKQSKE